MKKLLLLLAMLAIVPILSAQQEPDLSRYGSLARQQIVRQNLELQRQQNYIRMRRRIRSEFFADRQIVWRADAYSSNRCYGNVPYRNRYIKINGEWIRVSR